MDDTKEQLIQKKLSILEDNSDTYGIELSVPNGWLFHNNGNWYVVRYTHKCRPRVEGSCYDDRTEMFYFLKSSPMEIRTQEECGEAYGSNIWEHTQDQYVFDSTVERCHWCPSHSENEEITAWESVEDGVVNLCSSCEKVWNDQNELVQKM
jgi:hypothetical protein